MHVGFGEVLGIIGVAGIPLTLALTMPASTPREFRFLRGCLWVFGAIIVASLFIIQWNDGWGSPEMNVVVNVLIAAFVVGGVSVGIEWLKKKESEATGQKAESVRPSKNSPPINAGRDVIIGHIGDVVHKPSSYVGRIQADTILFSAKNQQTVTQLEIGDSGTIFVPTQPDIPLFKFTEHSELLVEAVDGELKVSTKLFDRKGELIAELFRNEWKIAPPPRTWDRNYNKSAVEVKDNTGQIVLQVIALPDRIKIQGEWWQGRDRGMRFVSNGPGAGAQIQIYGPVFPREKATLIRTDV